jgi:hypothetical protein
VVELVVEEVSRIAAVIAVCAVVSRERPESKTAERIILFIY